MVVGHSVSLQFMSTCCCYKYVDINCDLSSSLQPAIIQALTTNQPKRFLAVVNFKPAHFYCSFDLRSSSGRGQHWKDKGVLAERGYVYYEETPHSCRSSLNLDPVVEGDGGQYRCRVDYETSPTRNTRIKLKLVGTFN